MSTFEPPSSRTASRKWFDGNRSKNQQRIVRGHHSNKHVQRWFARLRGDCEDNPRWGRSTHSKAILDAAKEDPGVPLGFLRQDKVPHVHQFQRFPILLHPFQSAIESAHSMGPSV